MFPSQSAALCNDLPHDPRNSLFHSDVSRVSLLDGERLVTVTELPRENNGLYDGLVLVRDEFGAFAYRVQQLFTPEQLQPKGRSVVLEVVKPRPVAERGKRLESCLVKGIASGLSTSEEELKARSSY